MKAAPWIRLIAYRERPNATQTARQSETDADAASRIGRRIVGQLRAAVAAKLDSSRTKTDPPAARIDDRPVAGFQVSSTDGASSKRTLAIALVGRTASCRYSRVTADGVPVSRDQWLSFVVDQRALVVWDHGVRRRFAGIDALATFLVAAMSTFDRALL